LFEGKIFPALLLPRGAICTQSFDISKISQGGVDFAIKSKNTARVILTLGELIGGIGQVTRTIAEVCRSRSVGGDSGRSLNDFRK